MVKKRFFVTFGLALLMVFLIGVIVGNTLSTSKTDEITQFIRENELNTESYLIEQDLIERLAEEDCAIAQMRVQSLSHELWQIGRRLEGPDAEQELGAENYNFLKRKFHLMQIKTYTLMRTISEQCSGMGPVVLFYFSRDQEDSGTQGEILDKLVADYNVTVFAIEYQYSPELAFLEEYYQVHTTPALVLNYEQLFEGLTSYETLEAAIHN